MVLLINLVIAILSDTYQKFSDQKLGLYYDGVIEVIPSYKYKNFFGALIAACPPFNLLVAPFTPIFAITRKKRKLRRLNNVLVKLIFMPFALIYASGFAIANLLMMPLAYLKTVYLKAALITSKNRELLQKRHLVGNLVFFIFLGLPMLLLSQITDFYYFLAHLYLYKQERLHSERIVAISPEAFNTLEAVVQREVKQLKARNPRDPLQMKTQDLLKTLRTELEITTCIQSLIFGKFCSLREFEE